MIFTIISIDYPSGISKSKKAVKNNKKNRATIKKNEFYNELHAYLTASITKPVNISDKLSHFCSEYQRDQAYLNLLIKAYKYTTKELLT